VLRRAALLLCLAWAASPGVVWASSTCRGAVGGKPGQCAPDFTLRTLDGREVRLSDLRNKVVFLNFWATWCPPCATEIPAMEKLNRQFQGKRFEMLAVSIDTEGATAIRKYFKDTFRGVTPSFPILLDTGRNVSGRFGTFQVPETYVLDGTGRVRDKVEGVREWTDGLIVHYLELLMEGTAGRP
jgi:peroxiredoxin